MIRSPAGYGGEVRIKRYLDYYQPSYGAMMLAEGLFGFSTPAGVLLGAETSGMAIDFTSTPTSTLVRTANSLSTNYYSGLPFQNEGNGPVTFSRTSNATVTDSDGLIKWAGHNLLTNSESFDASAWTKSSATVTANSEAAPNNTTTGDTIAASGANGTALQSYTALAVPYTFSVWLKRKTGTGTIEIAADNGTYTAVTITSSWALYTVTQTPAAGSKSAGIRIVSSGDEVYAWGAHLYRSDLGGMVLNPARGDAYYPTTPRNLLGYTESLTTGWTNTNTTDSIVTETTPNGLASSVEVTATAGNGTLLGSLSLLASPYTFSIWLKRKTGTGTVEITVDGTTYVTAAVTSSWQRFSTTLTPSAGTRTPGIRIVTSGDAVFAWGAQLSNSASLDAYSPVYGAAVTSAAYYAPRLDFSASGSALGLLVEEQRTNLLLRSSEFDNVVWGRNNLTITANTIAAPDGSTSGDTLLATAGTAATFVVQTTLLSAVAHAVSFVAKAGTHSFIQILNSGDNQAFANFNLSTGASGTTGSKTTASITNLGNGWYRCTAVFNATVTFSNSHRLYMVPASTSAFAAGLTAAGTETVYLYSAQLEAGSFATSYIPTSASTATRTPDVASVSTQAFPYSSTAGSIVVNADTYSFATIRRNVQLDDGTASERMYIGTNTAAAPFAIVIDGNSTQADLTASGTLSANTPYKLALAYNVNDFAACGNGGTVATDTSGTVPTVNTMRLGASEGGVYLNGHIRQITYIPRRLSNSELQQRTSV